MDWKGKYEEKGRGKLKQLTGEFEIDKKFNSLKKHKIFSGIGQNMENYKLKRRFIKHFGIEFYYFSSISTC